MQNSLNYTVFEYLYRDAANYKAYGLILLRGCFSERHEADIRKYCERDEYFVAEQLDIPSLCELLWVESSGPSEDDHGWHEFIGLRPPEVGEETALNEWGKLDELLMRFISVQEWNLKLSKNA